MAQKTTVQLIDDLDGGPADETVEFSLDGTNYQIDLSEQHASELRDALATYVGNARRGGGAGGTPRRGGAPRQRSGGGGGGDRARLQEIRAWGKDNGFQVSERGRLSHALVEAYEAAH